MPESTENINCLGLYGPPRWKKIGGGGHQLILIPKAGVVNRSRKYYFNSSLDYLVVIVDEEFILRRTREKLSQILRFVYKLHDQSL
jgi:hypothetical protein